MSHRKASAIGSLQNQGSGTTSFKELEKKQSELIKNLSGAVYTCDAEGYVNFYTKAAAELWGREPEIGKDQWCGSWKIYEPDGITPVALDKCPMAIAIKERRSVRGKEIIIERPDGEKRKVLPYPDPIFDASGAIVKGINMLVDITDAKQN